MIDMNDFSQFHLEIGESILEKQEKILLYIHYVPGRVNIYPPMPGFLPKNGHLATVYNMHLTENRLILSHSIVYNDMNSPILYTSNETKEVKSITACSFYGMNFLYESSYSLENTEGIIIRYKALLISDIGIELTIHKECQQDNSYKELSSFLNRCFKQLRMTNNNSLVEMLGEDDINAEYEIEEARKEEEENQAQ